MQCVIMAGGKGTRLKSVTGSELPKPMASIGKKPVLAWQIETLRNNGIDQILLVTGYLGEKIEAYFGDGSAFGIPISYYREKTPLGTAGALGILMDRLEEDFVLAFGDVIFDIDVQRMWQFHQERQAAATLFVHPNGHPHDSDLIEEDDAHRVTGVLSKKRKREGWHKNLVNAGFYILNRRICDGLSAGERTDLERDLLTRRIAREKDVYAYRSTEYIRDIGTPERLSAVEADLQNGIVAAGNLKNRQRAVFFDRDGTLNVYRGLIARTEALALEKGAAQALNMLHAGGYLCMMVTNQPVVARGMCAIEDVEEIHAKLETLLGEEGAYLDDGRYCPHHPDKGYPEENPVYKVLCRCRKPGIGMIEELAEKYNIDLTKSWMVGDSTVDIQTGIHAGTHTALVRTGVAGTDGKYDMTADCIGSNLVDVAGQILKENG